MSGRYIPIVDRFGQELTYPLSSPEVLLGYLIAHRQGLPEWLFEALMDNLQRQLPDDKKDHFKRWSLMRHALDDLKKTWDEAPYWVSEELSIRGYRPAKPGTVMRSYNKIEAKRRKELGAGRPRTYKRAR